MHLAAIWFVTLGIIALGGAAVSTGSPTLGYVLVSMALFAQTRAVTKNLG